MLRRTLVFFERRRLGVFPVHLDPPTEQHLTIWRQLLADHFDQLIVLPYARANPAFRFYRHLAAMSILASRDVANLSVDLHALENPDPALPRIAELMKDNPDASIVHWAPSMYEVAQWAGSEELLSAAHFTVLQPKDSPETVLNPNPIHVSSVEVEHEPGVNVRRKMFDGHLDAKKLPKTVQRYIDSNLLYSDFRKSGRKETYFGFQGLAPRLEILYDPQNPVACGIHETLSPFQVAEGEQPDLIVPIGGDGYMLHSIRKHWRRYIPFFGLNAGTVGYLLNNPAFKEDLLTAPLRLYDLSMLYVKTWRHDGRDATREEIAALTAQDRVQHQSDDEELDVTPVSTLGKPDEHIAFNDAWMERNAGQTALLDIYINGDRKLKKVRGDGALVSTAAGSTAYSSALGSSPMPVSCDLMQLVGSNIVSPGGWKPVHLNQESVITLNSIDNWKRPCRGFVDSVDVGLVKLMELRTSRVASVQLAFSDKSDLQSKLYAMQFPGFDANVTRLG